MKHRATKPLTIGEVSRRSGVGIETVRYYERQGLLAKPARAPSGYRQFDEEVIARLQFIQRAKELGFSLNEIKELLALRIASGATCAQVKERADTKIQDIQCKIRTLERMKRALKKLSSACSGNGRVNECPILDALEDTK